MDAIDQVMSDFEDCNLTNEVVEFFIPELSEKSIYELAEFLQKHIFAENLTIGENFDKQVKVFEGLLERRQENIWQQENEEALNEDGLNDFVNLDCVNY
ncbi:hypothetical protein [Neisseria sp. Ec49-e6-T10]|uniref:hypothetical protein n=1 Tax=Neisseria sp. Ec49-e6-T10 TaxID=3140744 RepID=UPI003EB6DAAB